MLAPPFTPYGWNSLRTQVDLYYGVPRAVKAWNDPAGQNKIKYRMAGLPIVKDILLYEDNNKRMDDYMKNRHLDWADVKYPSLMFGAGYGGRLVSDVTTVARLYR